MHRPNAATRFVPALLLHARLHTLEAVRVDRERLEMEAYIAQAGAQQPQPEAAADPTFFNKRIKACLHRVLCLALDAPHILNT